MAQVFQHLFFELLAEPTQPGFDGLVSLARFVGQFPERSLVHVSGLDQFAFVRRPGRERFAKDFAQPMFWILVAIRLGGQII